MAKNIVSTDYATAWAVGGIFGIMHGVILYSSMLTLSTASYMIYKDAYKVPIMLTLLVDAVVLIGVASSVVWMPRMMKFRDEVVERLEEETEEMEDDDTEDKDVILK